MGMSKEDIENINKMNARLEKKRKPGFWSGVRKGVQARAKENRERRISEDKIRKEAFQKGRRAELKRQASVRGRASAKGWTYTSRGNYNPIGALFDSGMRPALGPRKRSSKKKKGKKKTKSAYGSAFEFDAVDNWGLW